MQPFMVVIFVGTSQQILQTSAHAKSAKHILENNSPRRNKNHLLMGPTSLPLQIITWGPYSLPLQIFQTGTTSKVSKCVDFARVVPWKKSEKCIICKWLFHGSICMRGFSMVVSCKLLFQACCKGRFMEQEVFLPCKKLRF